MQPKLNRWREGARRPRLVSIDAYALAPVILLVKPTWITAIIAVSMIVFLVVVEKVYEVSVPVALRAIRCKLAGRRRRAVPWWRVYKS